MSMEIADNILKYYLRNVYFITGTAYAGKSTMVRMLAERYNMVQCGENYHMAVSDRVAEPAIQPNLCYMRTMSGWEEFVKRPPEEYARWIRGGSEEVVGFEVAQLIALGQDRRVIVDTNIPLDMLHRISDERHVAVMLSPQSMSVERFFDRSDPEKQFLLRVIEGCEHPDEVMANFREGIRLVNSPEVYREYANSGFFTLVRHEGDGDTHEQTLRKLAEHFALTE